MATSGTTTFDLSVDELIEEAYERCGLELRTGYDLETARRSLNLMIAEWGNRGLNQWLITKNNFTVTEGTNYVDLGTDIIDVTSAVLQKSDVDYQLERISRSDFLYIPNKTAKARPTQFFLERHITPRFYMYPTPENSTDVVYYYALTRMQDAGDYINNMETVFRFLPCMTAGLAYYLAIKRAPDRVVNLKAIYDEEFDRAAFEDIDSVSSRFLPPRQVI
tara:strand:- start:2894 stop:3553 length:660 start_codon:yes stop_codon:yes gene_type:complete